eukprot:TRINITY_DN22127_c0_g1_i1.p1 TRINITY_DN22127_c0_g1~~TRINITY_DN22127_c0_g1_i1.p1  ORF type:complete len:379 (+),score=118.44 TRINITY_DN22127_c0_g1_i1:1038-2174(+)
MAICLNCFKTGKYPREFSSDDFVETKAQSDSSKDSWSDDEKFRLVEALEKYGDDWDEIASHVSTKTKPECVEYFVRMPIEDSFLEQYQNLLGVGKVDHPSHPSEYTPFGDLGNPLLAQVAFLASMVSPAVASAAAQKTIEKISAKKVEGQQLKLEAPNVSTQGQSLANSKTPQNEEGESMEVDDQQINEDAKEDTPTPDFLSSEEMKNISIEALASAAAKAKELSDKEFRSMEVDDQQINEDAKEDTPTPDFLSSEEMKNISIEALASAAAKAKELSDKEFRSMVSAIFELVALQIKKTELKLKHFETMELLLTREKEHLEKCRQKLFAERLQLTDARIKLTSQARQVELQRQEIHRATQLAQQSHNIALDTNNGLAG